MSERIGFALAIGSMEVGPNLPVYPAKRQAETLHAYVEVNCRITAESEKVQQRAAHARGILYEM
ncbi:MAG: hypothetical protein GY792_12940 [Gammaproteobacteria bacterium]|nr:hypothetical protein [Gammaproteobacteria bacterium]